MHIRTTNGYSESFKLHVVHEVESGRLRISEANRKYNILGHSTILKWLRKYGSFSTSKRKVIPTMNKETYEILRLKNEISSLKTELEDSRMKNVVLETMVDIAEKEFEIPIRKKVWCQTIREVKDYSKGYKIGKLCRLFGKSRQSFHQMEKRRLQTSVTDEILLVYVKGIRKYQPRIGTRKLYTMLQEIIQTNQIKLGRDKFFLYYVGMTYWLSRGKGG